ncbi:MAG: hypothetical protein RLZZ09_3243 [Pseudomonadota bacterium]|jgi:hypothetical protein
MTITIDRAVAQQALEALESTQLYCAHEHYPRRRVADALAALRAALKQPEQKQKPVALPCCGYIDASAIKWNPFNGVVQCHNCGQTYTALRAALEQPEQDPVACIRTWHKKNGDQHAELWDWCDGIGSLPEGEHLLYTHPPRREWRGLTEEEIYPLYSEPSSDAEMVEFARAIEAALKERNA